MNCNHIEQINNEKDSYNGICNYEYRVGVLIADKPVVEIFSIAHDRTYLESLL